jgi:predicted transcriptional regulator
MKKPLLDVIFASEKRKGALLMLQDGAKEMGYLLESLSTTRQACFLRLKYWKNIILLITTMILMS